MRIAIAGAGIGGLAFAALASRNGHDVTVYERSPVIREVGAGLYLKPNTLRVLDHVGVVDEIRAGGIRILERRTCTGTGRTIQAHALAGHRETWMAPREVVIQALRTRAVRDGVDIRLGSHVTSATPDGCYTVGEEAHQADLLVAADGRYSMLRSSLGLTVQQADLPTLATRYLIPGREATPEPVTIEYWKGRRRIGIVPSNETHTYSYVICHAGDDVGCEQPLNVDSWAADFPVLGNTLELFATAQAVQHAYPIVIVRRWSRGRVALVGDSATALPPTLGQGSGLALMNAAGLAAALGKPADAIEPLNALARWERDYRPVSDRTQRWALRYDAMTNRWPAPVRPLRAPTIWAMNNIPWIRTRLRAADTFRPSFNTSTFTTGATA